MVDMSWSGLAEGEDVASTTTVSAATGPELVLANQSDQVVRVGASAKLAADGIRWVVDLGTHAIEPSAAITLAVDVAARVDMQSLRYSAQLLAVAEVERADGKRESLVLDPVHFHPAGDQVVLYTAEAKATDHRAGDFRAIHAFDEPARYCDSTTCYERVSIEQPSTRPGRPQLQEDEEVRP
jgi:hypothetical protein